MTQHEQASVDVGEPDVENPEWTDDRIAGARRGHPLTWQVREEAAANLRRAADVMRHEADRLEQEANHLVGPGAKESVR